MRSSVGDVAFGHDWAWKPLSRLWSWEPPSGNYVSVKLRMRALRVKIKMWWFPRIGVPPNHPFLWDFLHKPTSYWGTPILGNLHVGLDQNQLCHISIDVLVKNPSSNPSCAPSCWAHLLTRLVFFFVSKSGTWKNHIVYDHFHSLSHLKRTTFWDSYGKRRFCHR